MPDTDTLDHMMPGKEHRSLIEHLWERLQPLYEALATALEANDPHAFELELQFRTLALLMASEPARSWPEVAPKVAVTALLRDDDALGVVASVSHLAAMLEAAVDRDHCTLNDENPPN